VDYCYYILGPKPYTNRGVRAEDIKPGRGRFAKVETDTNTSEWDH